MKGVQSIKTTLASHRKELFDRFSIRSLAVFGSYARGEESADSDVDLLVEFDQPIGVEFVDLAEQLESLLGQRVDLVSRQGVKPKYLERIKNDLQYV